MFTRPGPPTVRPRHPDLAVVRSLPSVGVMVRDVTYLLLTFPLGIVTFTVAVTGISLAAGLAITLLGIPLLLGTLLACRWAAGLERTRAAALLGTPISAPERVWEGGLWQRSLAAATDPAAWRNLLWAVLLLPLGITTFTIAVTLWSAALGLVTSPLWYWALPQEADETIALIDDHSLGYAVLRVLIGLALVPLATAGCRALADGTARLTRAVLGGS